MSWRTVVINSRCKLDLKMGFMVIRGEETQRVFIDEIAMVIIENSAVSITGCLLNALTEKKVSIVFCDNKRNPLSELLPLYGSYDCSRKIKMQMDWSNDVKGAVWTEIVAEKIRKQSEFLYETGAENEADMLCGYLTQLEFFDATNREGHSAKVYFNSLFGMDFTRSADNVTNAALNYGYGILLSAFNREITANGYLTQLGLFHDNVFNHFNLSCDLMEPFRIIVDKKVKNRNYIVFESEQKHDMISIVNEYVYIDNSRQTLINAVKIYTKSIFDALNDGDISKIKFYRNI